MYKNIFLAFKGLPFYQEKEAYSKEKIYQSFD